MGLKELLKENIKNVKIALTNKLIPLCYIQSGIAIGYVFADGKISDLMDIPVLLVSIIPATFAIVHSFIVEPITYKIVETTYKHEGFTKFIMKNRSFRRKAKIYATENGIMEEFKLAKKEPQEDFSFTYKNIQ